MTAQREFARRGLLLTTVGIVCAAVGGGAVYLLTRSPRVNEPHPPANLSEPQSPSPAGPAVMTLTRDAVTRAGLETDEVRPGGAGVSLRVPGRVEANAYTQVVLTAVAPGRVLSVAAELGTAVTRGHVLARLHSADAAEQQQILLSMRAELDAAHAKLMRTEKLAALGSVSQQELEATRAEHTRHASDVQSARSRLLLLGLSAAQVDKLSTPDDISATIDVTAPRSGVVITRQIAPGQNVETGAELFTIVDLSTVWVVSDLYERDAAGVRPGMPVKVTMASLPGRAWASTLTYLDPQVTPETRTVRARADVENPDRALRLGAYVDVEISASKVASTLQVPTAAVQNIGDRHVVYVPDPSDPLRFVERAVAIGRSAPDLTEITAGLQAGERIVTVGSFFLRAERERLGLPMPAAPPAASGPSAPQRHEISVAAEGFVPSRVELRSGVPSELVFTRRSDKTCATEVVVPALQIRRALPLNVPVTIAVPAQPAGEVTFACGMNMLRGAIVVK